MKLEQHVNTPRLISVFGSGNFSGKKHVKRIYLEPSKAEKDVVMDISEAWDKEEIMSPRQELNL